MVSNIAHGIHWMLDRGIDLSLNIILWIGVIWLTICLIEKANKTIRGLSE